VKKALVRLSAALPLILEDPRIAPHFSPRDEEVRLLHALARRFRPVPLFFSDRTMGEFTHRVRVDFFRGGDSAIVTVTPIAARELSVEEARVYAVKFAALSVFATEIERVFEPAPPHEIEDENGC